MHRFATRQPPRQRLLIFARVPEPGLVKTRLAAQLGDDRALEVYGAMLHDLLEAIGPSDEEIEVEVLWTGSDAVDAEMLRRTFPGRQLAMQAGSTLGDRLAIAFAERLFFHRAEKVIAIGVDDPSVDRAQISTAFGLLESCEWTVGPASDGGYYLIGCRESSFRAEVFGGIEWGTSSVLAESVRRIHEAGATLALLPIHDDIDRIEDLQRFSRNVPTHATRMRHTLSSWGWES